MLRIEHPLGFPPPAHWADLPSIPASEYQAWLRSTKPPKDAPKEKKEGRRNAEAGFCDILGHRYRSRMERRFGLFLKALGYEYWPHKEADPPEGGLYYRYEGPAFEFAGVKGRNHAYTPDFEVWPGLPNVPEMGAPAPTYACYEVKGWLDKDSQVKLNRMTKRYPGVPVILVDIDLFKRITHGAERWVPGWNDRKEGAP